MKVAFISGPYRAATPMKIMDNIHRASLVALKYWRLGYAVICPHRNTALFDGEAHDSVWLEGDLELLRRSDVIVMMKGWGKSDGARDELRVAVYEGKEVIYD
jgi:hypothetical protein